MNDASKLPAADILDAEARLDARARFGLRASGSTSPWAWARAR